MEKRIILWVVGLVLVTLSVLTAAAAAANTVYFDPDPSSASPGNTTTVTLWLNASDGVASFNTWVHFNLSVVNITSGTAGDFPYSFWFDNFGDYVKMGGAGSTETEQTGHLKLADLTVKAISPGTSALWCTNNALYNQSYAQVSATWINGTFTCGALQPCLGTCCNDAACSEIHEPDMSCKECLDLENKYWHPNKDAACFDGASMPDLYLNYCPDCTDGVDNDDDGNTDFPSDVECTCGLDPSEVDPLPPIPELPTILLFSMGLLVLTGYVAVRKKDGAS
jgi:hypothetical protein